MFYADSSQGSYFCITGLTLVSVFTFKDFSFYKTFQTFSKGFFPLDLHRKCEIGFISLASVNAVLFAY